ncbi:Uma2 family endonuclease [uncultured Devosia sp.]|uniref:Uma2 family endonuclease n=1 Tax=uncultured Devosia sp. TaxID=211434 RepID=UPI0035CC2744
MSRQVVDCGPPNASALTAPKPTIVVDVSSPGTAVFDCGAKLREYEGVDGIDTVLQIESEIALVKVSRPQQGGTWTEKTIEDYAVAIPLPSLARSITLNEIYDTLDTRPRPTPASRQERRNSGRQSPPTRLKAAVARIAGAIGRLLRVQRFVRPGRRGSGNQGRPSIGNLVALDTLDWDCARPGTTPGRDGPAILRFANHASCMVAGQRSWALGCAHQGCRGECQLRQRTAPPTRHVSMSRSLKSLTLLRDISKHR